MKKRSELEKLEEIPNSQLRSYVTLPKGFVVVEEKLWSRSLAWNPASGEVRVYHYTETPCYVDNAHDIQYNGNYTLSDCYNV